MRRRIAVWARRAAIGLVIVWSLFPVYWALNTSLMTNAQAQSTSTHFFPIRPIFANYQAIFGAGPQSAEAAGGIGRSLLNIVVESGFATLLTLVIAILGAYAFARLRFRLKNLFFYTVLATLTLPVYATLIPLYRIMSEAGLVNTYLGIILVYASGFMPLAMWIMYNVFLALPPSIEEAAVIDGASMLQTFYRVALPIAKPGIAATAIITFLLGWGQFIFPLVLSSTGSTQPLTVVLAVLEGRHVVPYTIINAAAIVAVAIPAVLVFLLNRWIVEGIIAGSVK
jgi:multiple sugar transport system permease protein